jgi:hypothetical protein
MQPWSPLRCACLLTICAGISLLSGCGGSSSHSEEVTPPTSTPPGAAIAGCQIKQINALKPPCPTGLSCVTTSCTANALSCSTLSQGNWAHFSQNILAQSSIYGVNIYVPWASVETSQGSYDFSALDAQVGYYTTNYPSKKVNLLWMAVNYGNINNSVGGVNQMTPAYVFTTSYASSLAVGPQDVAYCTNYPGNGTFSNTTANASTTNFDSTGYPVVYETPFTTAYEAFVKNVIKHYNNNSTIGYMRFGLSVGDEADAYCTAQMQALPAPNTFASPTTWETYINTMDGFEKSQNPTMTLMESLNVLDTTPDPTTLPAFEAQTAVSNGFGFGSNGWQQSDMSDIASGNLTACTADWCALFKQYSPGGTPQVPLELQTAVPSDESASNAVGDLATLISQSAAVNDATILEISQDDLYLAFNSTLAPSTANLSEAQAYNDAITHPCNEAPSQ